MPINTSLLHVFIDVCNYILATLDNTVNSKARPRD